MKLLLIIGYLVLFTLIQGGLSNLQSQTKWNKYPGNPVFEPGAPEEWDNWLGNASILFDQNQYKMWYTAWDPTFDWGKIGYATSVDGINWTKYYDNPLKFSCGGVPCEIIFIDLEVLKLDSLYYMWFSANQKDEFSVHLGFAKSVDGLYWIVHPESVLEPGQKDKWDGDAVLSPGVYYDGKRFQMWYVGADFRVPSMLRIGYATSKDGINWKKYTSNPVVDIGDISTWDYGRLEIGDVLYNGSFYEMWYVGFNFIRMESGYARSPDGIHWTKHPYNPILQAGELGTWDTWGCAVTDVIRLDSTYRMWYIGYDGEIYNQFGYATTSEEEAMCWDNTKINRTQKRVKIRALNRAEYINPDSLISVLPQLKGISLIDTYNKLALAYSLNNTVKSLEFAKKALEISQKVNYPKGTAQARYSIGISHYVLDDYTNALANQLIALHLFDSLGMHFDYADLLCQIADIHQFTGAHEEAVLYYQKALGVFEQLQDTTSLLTTLFYPGNALLEGGDTASALQLFQKRLSLAKEAVNIQMVINSYHGLGRCYFSIRPDSSLYYYMEAKKILDTLPTYYWKKGQNQFLMGEVFLSLGNEYYPNAEQCFDSSFYYLKSVAGRYYRIRLLYDIAELKFLKGNFYKAEELLRAAEELCRHYYTKDDYRMYTSLGGKLESKVFLKKYMERIYRLRFRLDTTQYNANQGVKHLLLANQWKDSIYDEQNRKQVAMLQGRYENEKIQDQIAVLENENELKDLRIQQSRIFLFGMGGFVIVIVLVAFLFIRQNNIRAEYKSVMLEQKLLRLQMNPHFIFNALSNILNLIQKKRNEVAAIYLTKFSKLLRNILEGSRKELITLDMEITGMENYLELQKLRFGEKFDFEIIVDDDIDTEDTFIPPLLVQPFIENAIEHGIMHKKTKGHVSLKFKAVENQVVCHIEDDGVGRENAWKIEYSKRKDHKSLATTITRERIQTLNKTLKKKIKLIIEDLKNNIDEPAGTKVTLIIPQK